MYGGRDVKSEWLQNRCERTLVVRRCFRIYSTGYERAVRSVCMSASEKSCMNLRNLCEYIRFGSYYTKAYVFLVVPIRLAEGGVAS